MGGDAGVRDAQLRLLLERLPRRRRLHGRPLPADHGTRMRRLVFHRERVGLRVARDVTRRAAHHRRSRLQHQLRVLHVSQSTSSGSLCDVTTTSV